MVFPYPSGFGYSCHAFNNVLISDSAVVIKQVMVIIKKKVKHLILPLSKFLSWRFIFFFLWSFCVQLSNRGVWKSLPKYNGSNKVLLCICFAYVYLFIFLIGIYFAYVMGVNFWWSRQPQNKEYNYGRVFITIMSLRFVHELVELDDNLQIIV